MRWPRSPRADHPGKGGFISLRQRITLVTCGMVLLAVVAYGASAYRTVRANERRVATDGARRAAGDMARILDGSVATLTERHPEVPTEPFQRFLTGRQADDRSLARAALIRLVAQAAGAMDAELLDARGSVALDTDTITTTDATPAPGGPIAGPGPIRMRDGVLAFPLVTLLPSGGAVSIWYPVGVEANARGSLEALIGPGASLTLANRDGSLWTDFSKPIEPLLSPDLFADTAAAHRSDVGTPSVTGLAPLSNAPWTVAVSFGVAAMDTESRGLLFRFLAIGGALTLLTGMSTWAAGRSIGRPIEELVAGTRAIMGGDYSTRIPVRRKDEIGALAESFNEMAQHVESGRRSIEQRVNELTESEARLAAAEDRLNQALLASGVVLFELEVDGTGVLASWFSPSLRTLLGHEPDQADPAWWRANVHPEDLPGLQAMVAPAFGQDGTSRIFRFRRADEEYRWIREEQHLAGSSPGVLRVTGSWMDVTEARKAELQLRQAQKMEAVGRLAGGVAHDFNNILTAILGEAESALQEGPTKESVRESLEAVRNAAVQASSLTRQLLSFSRRSAGTREMLDLNAVVEDLGRMITRLLGATVTLELDLDPELHPIVIDPDAVSQVIVNLAVNARDAMPDGGTVMIQTRNTTMVGGGGPSAGAAGGFVTLAVSDTGAGMSADVRERIFEPFFTTKPSGQGTGLGLSTCYSIVHQAGGEISVYSEPGLGTTMRARFPSARAVQEAGDGGGDVGGGFETVLVVDDEEDARVVASRALSRAGYRVLSARGGAEALEISDEHEGPIHLLLTDIVMPGMGGRALAAALLTRRPDTRVLFMTGYADDFVTRQELVEVGAGLLQKPFELSSLLRSVRGRLDAR